MPKRIMIVDDSDHLRWILKLTLQYKDYAVLEAENGQIALQLAAAEPCDLILCDIEMPVMNGLEFLRRYRTELGATTPVVMLTAEGGELTSKALAAGATAIIHKPFEPIALMNELEKYMV